MEEYYIIGVKITTFLWILELTKDNILLFNRIMLTKSDFVEIEKIIDQKTVNFATKEDLGNLPTKDELYEKLDEIMGELKAGREERELIIGKVYDNHEPRIVNLEENIALQTS